MNPIAFAPIRQQIDAFLTEEPPRARSLAVTVFGDSISPRGGRIWLSDLIALLAPFGVNDRLVRTSVFRLSEEGWLESGKEGRRARYGLTATGRNRFEHAHRRIYTPPRADWDGLWTLAIMPRAGSGDLDQGEARRELGWQGFAAPAPGLLAHPSPDLDALRESLARLGLMDKVSVVSARDLPGAGGRPLAERIRECWDLPEQAARYRRFIERFRPMAEAFGREVDAPAAFQARTLLIHAFRRALLHDPGLPREILPPDWPGGEAFDLCRTLYRLATPAAEAFLDPMLPPAGSGFADRFGGL